MPVPTNPIDALRLRTASAEHPLHVGALALLSPGHETDAPDIGEIFAAAVERDRIAEFWRRSAQRSVFSPTRWSWTTCAAVDLDYHVQTWALPRPGTEAELWRLVSRLHSEQLDPGRPAWEIHLIEGLADGRYGVYLKAHHALLDRPSAARLLEDGLTGDPSARDTAAPWELEPGDAAEPRTHGSGLGSLPTLVASATRAAVTDGIRVLPALADTLDRAMRRCSGPSTVTASRPLLDAPVGSARAVTGRSWALERLRPVAEASDATVFDVVLAMCAGALRRHLTARDGLPPEPLVALVPVPIQRRGEPDASVRTPEEGVRPVTCSLATHLPDPAHRLAAISATMRDVRSALDSADRAQLATMSALRGIPRAIGLLTGGDGPVRNPNVVITGLAGPTSRLYWNSAHLSALYPLSAPARARPLTITCMNNDTQVSFGLAGSTRATPALSAMLGHLDCELEALEAAVGL
ncbi:wax ester/triacylglycerol synthase family O-acyltransferase [Tsukamurella soli]|uniref:Diacylglycerol O-acyltransferase n=1 Tax=Tsukamurella soli TaxID=644556 RepID=A0ABP8K3G2_9ACTN